MKKLIIFSLLCLVRVQMQGQLVMNAGDSSAFATQLRFLGEFHQSLSFPSSFFRPTIAGFDVGDSVRLEMFEDNVNQTPFCSTLYETSTSCFGSGFWWDQQGAVRVSVLSGSVELQALELGFSSGGTRGFYSGATLVLIPEPTTMALLGLAGLAGCFYSRHRRRV